jgi:hypothetical protein
VWVTEKNSEAANSPERSQKALQIGHF